MFMITMIMFMITMAMTPFLCSRDIGPGAHIATKEPSC